MARENRVPQPVTYLQDFGLNVTPPPVNRNRRVVIIGTAEDGPMYEPIQIEKPEEAELVWGRNGVGDLVRGIYECWDVQGGTPTVVGVRIGNGVQASLDIAEMTGAGVNEEQGGDYTALTLEAKYPGQIYNQVTIGYDDQRRVAIYNPKTGLTSTFTVDTDSPTNPNVQAHNVQELVDAINADRNTSSVLEASFVPIIADYEIAVSGSSSCVSATSEKVVVDLEDAINFITQSGWLITDPINGEATAANNLLEVDTIEAVSISEWENLENKGLASVKFDLFPLDGKAPASWQTIQAMYDYDGDDDYTTSPSGNVVSEYIYALENGSAVLGDGGTDLSGYIVNGSGTNTFRVEVPICPDDSESSGAFGTAPTAIASGYIVGNATYVDYQGDWTNATTQYISTKTVNGQSIRPSGIIKVEISEDGDPNGFWQELPYDSVSGVYLSRYVKKGDSDPYTSSTVNYGYAEFSVGPSGYGVEGPMESLVHPSGYIREGKFLRVTLNTVKGFLTEKENLNALYPATLPAYPTVDSYFVRGQEVVFNTPAPYNIVTNYGTRITYEVGSTVDITNAANGEVTFSTAGLLPGPGGATLANDTVSYIRMRYSFMPTWPNITTSPKALSGGTNGTALTGRQRKEELAEVYTKMKNYQANLWVPMGAYIDSVTERYNPITGLKEEIPVGFADDLEEFLEDLSINAIQPHAILGVEPIRGQVTQAGKDTWVERLTVQDITDPNRGANVMARIGSKFMSVVAFEPIFLNIGRGRPYTANGQATYAGVLASIPYDISPMNKPIPGVSNVRFDLSLTQYENMNDARYVTMKVRPGRVPVVLEDKTAAPIGSDFVNWSVYSITAEAADRVYAVAETFIGKQNTTETRASLEQLISNELMSMTGLRGFNFTMSSTADQQVLGIIEIDLILVPVFTIKKIRTTVKLRKNLPTAQ